MRGNFKLGVEVCHSCNRNATNCGGVCSMAAAIKEGFLRKKGLLGVWHDRWAVLERGYLRLYKKQGDMNPSTIIAVGGDSTAALGAGGVLIMPAEQSTKRPNTFKIAFPNKDAIFFAAETKQSRDEWVNAICSAANQESWLRTSDTLLDSKIVSRLDAAGASDEEDNLFDDWTVLDTKKPTMQLPSPYAVASTPMAPSVPPATLKSNLTVDATLRDEALAGSVKDRDWKQRRLEALTAESKKVPTAQFSEARLERFFLTYQETEDEPVIGPDGIMELCADLGIDPEDVRTRLVYRK